jgi:colanic acid biosynthesis glycosyl transferase WcaI
MAGKQGLETLLEAARLLEGDDSLRFVMCGDGAAREKLHREYGSLSNVIWLPLQPAERLNELLNLADIHLLIQLAGVVDLVMPSKLTGMLASGRPVVATAKAESQIAEVVAQCGIAVPPGDANALATAIRALGADPERRQRLGKAGRDYAVRTIDLSSVLGEFERALISCCKETRT